MIAEGGLALCEAALKYRGKAKRFHCYARVVIRGTILTNCFQSCGKGQAPTRTLQALHHSAMLHGWPWDSQTNAELAGVSAVRLRRACAWKMLQDTVCIEDPAVERRTGEFHRDMYSLDLKELFGLARLPKTERFVVLHILLYGHTLKDLSERLTVTQKEVRKILGKGIDHLQEELADYEDGAYS